MKKTDLIALVQGIDTLKVLAHLFFGNAMKLARDQSLWVLRLRLLLLARLLLQGALGWAEGDAP